MRGWLALGLVSVLLLSGCATKSDTSSSSSHPATATQTVTAAPVAAANHTNHAPTGAIHAKAGNGTAALNVTFSLTGRDADGDHLNWTLAFGDHANRTGAALPANVTHAYAKPGLYNVTYTLTDGKNATTYHSKVNVTAGGVAFTPIDSTQSWVTSAGGATEFAVGCRAKDVDCAYFDIPADAGGRAFTMEFSATVPAAVYFIDVYLDGKYDSTFQLAPGATSITDKVPAGTSQFRAYAAGGALVDAHLVIP
jgi:hypothetical protein